MKILFICKQRNSHDNPCWYGDGISSGLLNSATFVNDMLDTFEGVHSKIVQVKDNNDIDREVHKYKPTHVIIEALWVIPKKFHVLIKLHPEIKWIIRLHSELAFLSHESIAMEWIFDYLNHKNVYIASNSLRLKEEIEYLSKKHVIYLPNYYPVDWSIEAPHKHIKNHIDIGCFGAIRILKNHLAQAVGSIRFADSINKKLHFHINSTRIESHGSTVLKNLRDLFKHTHDRHRLVESPWFSHKEFIEKVRHMDIGLQASFTETYNIVMADFVNNCIPVVASSEISFVSPAFVANPNSSADIEKKLKRAWKFRSFNFINKYYLQKNSNFSEDCWVEFIHHQKKACIL